MKAAPAWWSRFLMGWEIKNSSLERLWLRGSRLSAGSAVSPTLSLPRGRLPCWRRVLGTIHAG